MVQTLRIFISSPGDVGQERAIAERVIARLRGEFGASARLEPLLWEHEPVRATRSFQEQIVRPAETDIVVCILWSRLGTRLPDGFERRPDGTPYESGTAFEFEDASRAFDEHGVPDLLVYHKTAEPLVSLRDPERLRRQQAQWAALEAYLRRWFWNADGTFRAGFSQFETVEEFEQLLEAHLRRLIGDKLKDKLKKDGIEPGEDRSVVTWHRGSPFRGLEVFEFEHAPVFFGRTRAIGELREALVHQAARGRAFVLVFGMSGCGKSSLVRAGLLPILTQPGVIEGVGLWRWCVFRPSDAAGGLCDGLARWLTAEGVLPELSEAGASVEELAEAFRQAPEQAIPLLRMGLHRAAEAEGEREKLVRPPEPRLGVVIDQLEELFTLDWIDARERERFVALLSALAQSGPVWVIATMRSDFYHRCAELPVLTMLAGDAGQYHLLPPRPAEIGQMIRQPAQAAGLAFEVDPKSGIGLDAAIEEAAVRDPGALPLLEFTLEALYQAAHRAQRRVLSFDSYQALGGLEGALAQRAEETFEGLPEAVQKALPAVLAALVTVDPRQDKPAAARRVPLDAVASTPEATALVDALIQARLLVADRTDGSDGKGKVVVRVAHEALLAHWPRLRAWIEENRDYLRTRARVEAAAALWLQNNKDKAFLLVPGKPLTEARELLARHRPELESSVVDFIEASIWKARRKRISLGAVAVAIVLAIGVAVLQGQEVARQVQETARQENIALARQLIYQAEALRDQPERLEERVRTALQALVHFKELDMPSVEADQAVRRGMALLPIPAGEYHLDIGAISAEAAVFDPTGRFLAVADERSRVLVWDTVQERQHAAWSDDLPASASVLAVDVSMDGAHLATLAYDASPNAGVSTVTVWQLPEGRPRIAFQRQGRLERLRLSPTGQQVYASKHLEPWWGWHIASGEELEPFADTQFVHYDLAFSPDGRHVATAIREKGTRDHIVRILEVDTGKESNRWVEDARVGSLGWTADSRKILIGTPETVLSREAATGQQRASYPRDGSGFVLSPDERLIAERMEGNTTQAEVRMAETGHERFRLSHPAEIKAMGFRAGSRSIVTLTVGAGAGDRKLHVWTLEGSRWLAELSHDDAITRLDFSSDSTLVVTGSATGERWWKLPAQHEALELPRESSSEAAAPGPGQYQVRPSGWPVPPGEKSRVDILDVRGERLESLEFPSFVLAAAISRGGRRLAVVTGDITRGGWRLTLEIWDPHRGERLEAIPYPVLVADAYAGFLAFSPDDRFIATASREGFTLWDAERLAQTGIIPHPAPRTLAFQPHGNLAATAGRDQGIRIWDRANWLEIARITELEDGLTKELVLSPDGRWLATLSDDGVVRLWLLQPDDLIAQACARLRGACP
ncbi:AAA family ATPase [Halomonas sp. BM-2019]|uniref:nSTAND1 domain-containing NTPase n=1 Tax=Halomonas sp. BM-2019 TaxID=2811227 RepID=UPI001B3C2A31|nr:MAG: AAA family ATPase [Halomonas sp. BM-2019]